MAKFFPHPLQVLGFIALIWGLFKMMLGRDGKDEGGGKKPVNPVSNDH
jgi:hypothetical protein